MSRAFLLRMFGALTLETDTDCITKFPTKRSALILARLAISKGHRMGRDELAELLWPDDFLDVTRSRLRQELRRLRQVCAGFGEYVITDRQWVELRPGSLVTDIDLFEGALTGSRETNDPGIKIQRLQAAVHFLVGPFLAGYQEPWVVSMRRDLDLQAKQAWLELSTAHLSMGRTEEAIHASLAAVRKSPLDIDANSHLIRLFSGQGLLDQAQQAFLDLDNLMVRELGCHAPASLKSFIREWNPNSVEEVSTTDPALRSHLPRPGPTLGRGDLLAVLEEILNRRGASVVLTGPLGVGKTHLVREAVWQFASRTNLPVQIGGIPAQVPDGLFIPQPGLTKRDLAEHIQSAKSIGWRVIAESRESLESDEIDEVSVAALPTPLATSSRETILTNSGVQLLLAKLPDASALVADPENVQALAEIVRAVDGLPAALSIVAKRLRIETPAEAAKALPVCLQEFAREAESRRGVDFLIHLVHGLPEEFQEKLLSLAILDGASADLVAKIVAPLDSTEVLQLLEKLCLISIQGEGRLRRYQVLKPIAYLLTTRVLRDRMPVIEAKTYRALGEWALAKSRVLAGPGQEVAFSLIQGELGNLRRALVWSLEKDLELAGMVVVGSWRTICARGNPALEQKLIREGTRLGAEHLTGKFAGEAWVGAATILTIAGDTEAAEQAYLKSIQVYEDLNYSNGTAWARMNYATNIVVHRDIASSTQMCKAAAEITTDAGDRTICLSYYAFGLAELGDFTEAIKVGETVFAMRMQSHDITEQSRAYADLAYLFRRIGRSESAKPLLVEGVSRLRKAGIQDMLFEALVNLVEINDDLNENLGLLNEASGIAQKMGSNLKLLEVARAQLTLFSRKKDWVQMLTATECTFRLTQASLSNTEMSRSLRCLATEFAHHNAMSYANVLFSAVGDEVNGPVIEGWATLLSSDSLVTTCVLTVVMAKQAISHLAESPQTR